MNNPRQDRWRNHDDASKMLRIMEDLDQFEFQLVETNKQLRSLNQKLFMILISLATGTKAFTGNVIVTLIS